MGTCSCRLNYFLRSVFAPGVCTPSCRLPFHLSRGGNCVYFSRVVRHDPCWQGRTVVDPVIANYSRLLMVDWRCHWLRADWRGRLLPGGWRTSRLLLLGSAVHRSNIYQREPDVFIFTIRIKLTLSFRPVCPLSLSIRLYQSSASRPLPPHNCANRAQGHEGTH